MSGSICSLAPAAQTMRLEHQAIDPTVPAFTGPTFSAHEPRVLVVSPKTQAAVERTGSTFWAGAHDDAAYDYDYVCNQQLLAAYDQHSWSTARRRD